MTKCPCYSGDEYYKCCEPIIRNQSATTALALMRSRYTAYCMENIEYLYESSHAKTKLEINRDEIEAWAKENSWTKLQIVEILKGEIKDVKGFVEFKAYFVDKKGKAQIHHEKSTFLKEDGKWFYVDGIANPQRPVINTKVSRNEPCPCGSGKKHKKCCA